VVKVSVAEEGERAEGGPNRDVATDERNAHFTNVLLIPANGLEQPDQRQARRQHHRGHHGLPGQEKEEEGGPKRWTAPNQAVVMQRGSLAGGLSCNRDAPSDGDRRQ
jgi:hypothetical protein